MSQIYNFQTFLTQPNVKNYLSSISKKDIYYRSINDGSILYEYELEEDRGEDYIMKFTPMSSYCGGYEMSIDYSHREKQYWIMLKNIIRHFIFITRKSTRAQIFYFYPSNYDHGEIMDLLSGMGFSEVVRMDNTNTGRNVGMFLLDLNKYTPEQLTKYILPLRYQNIK